MKLLFFVVISILLLSCSTTESVNTQFEALADNYINSLLKLNPEWATYLGNHEYDHKLNDYSLDGIKNELAFNRAYLDSLSTIDISKLTPNNLIDYKILKLNIKSTIFQLDTLKEYEWDPRKYNVGGAIYSLLAREFAPIKERLINVKNRIKEIPYVLEQAKLNLKNPVKVHTETAILQNSGVISLINNELNQFLDQAPELKDEFAPIQKEAVSALQTFGKWMQDELLPQANRDFRLGEEKFVKKLYYSLNSSFTKEEILRRAEEELDLTQNEMLKIATPLYEEFFPGKAIKDRKSVIKAVLDKLADDHPTSENIVSLAKQNLKECTDFVNKNNLVSVPTEPINIIVMPEFQRGIALAYCDAPGALEKNGETFYAISPAPKDWTAKKVLSLYREYNNYMLQNLTIHEATPGHYLQLAHANKYNGSTLIRSVFSSGTFIEGWATYAEQLMAEEGYGGDRVKMQQLKMRLRLIINSIIDQKIHAGGMTEEEAMDIMLNEGFQEEGEAAGKWRRACLSSTQLSTYFVGNLEVNDIRNAYKKKTGDNFNMKEFHDELLSFGSIAPKYVKELMEL